VYSDSALQVFVEIWACRLSPFTDNHRVEWGEMDTDDYSSGFESCPAWVAINTLADGFIRPWSNWAMDDDYL
jgi:hypothetical protein